MLHLHLHKGLSRRFFSTGPMLEEQGNHVTAGLRVRPEALIDAVLGKPVWHVSMLEYLNL